MQLTEAEWVNSAIRNQVAREIRAELDATKPQPQPKPLSRKAKMRRLLKAKAGK